jgi:hypothetical protein
VRAFPEGGFLGWKTEFLGHAQLEKRVWLVFPAFTRAPMVANAFVKRGSSKRTREKKAGFSTAKDVSFFKGVRAFLDEKVETG